MEASKEAIKDFLSKSGKHDTTVHEKVAPAVTHETVTPTRHENVQTAIDKEIHQDHYHTSAQPVVDREVLPEKHTHNLAAVEQRTFAHGNDTDVKRRLETEAAQFRDERVVNETQHTHSVAPVVAGEHIHHHVHETIQPVVQKETIQPNVVHTTVPIHEVHQNAAQHHSASALPAVSMEDFKKQGGVLSGREERVDGFEGEPRSVGGALSGGADELASGTSRGTGLTGTHHTGGGLTGTRDTTGTTGGLTGTRDNVTGTTNTNRYTQNATSGVGGTHTALDPPDRAGNLTGSRQTNTGIGERDTGIGIGGGRDTGTNLAGGNRDTGIGLGGGRDTGTNLAGGNRDTGVGLGGDRGTDTGLSGRGTNTTY